MSTAEAPKIDKSGWGAGPWQDEPDQVEWQHAGLPCLMVRHLRFGHWCGYVAVPPGHPAHGQDFHAVDVDVHGGLTYGAACHGEICHVPAPGEPADVWWLGFDLAHGGDLLPGLCAILRGLGCPWPGDGDQYRPVPYVQAETNRLADQLAAQACERAAAVRLID